MTTNNGYIIHSYTNPATAWDQWNTMLVSNLSVVQGGNAEVLVVAGGGGGGEAGGAGGAGGLIYSNPYALFAGITTNVTVGIAGAGRSGDRTCGFKGSDSTFGYLTAEGGGYGGGGWKYVSTVLNGGPGGSGGGSVRADYAAGNPNAGPPVQGNIGGRGTVSSAGGGGGGAGTAGIASSSGIGGDGGTGRYFAVFAAFGSPAGWFAGGGGGGTVTPGATRGTGGPGGA